MSFPYIPVTEEMCQIAWSEAESLGVRPNSITGGEGNFAGFLGEQAVAQYIGIGKSNTNDYDLLSERGLRVEVKSKRTTVPLRESYLGSVSNKNTTQQCDIYFFTRVRFQKNMGKRPPPMGVYIGGWLPKTTFFERAFFAEDGTKDPDGFPFKGDCWNVPYSMMNSWVDEDDVWQHLTA